MRSGFAVFAGTSVCLLVALAFVYGSVTSSIFERWRRTDASFLVLGDEEETDSEGPDLPILLDSNSRTLPGGAWPSSAVDSVSSVELERVDTPSSLPSTFADLCRRLPP